MKFKPIHEKTSTSWQPVSSWYNQLVGGSGQYFHQHLVLPGTLKLLELKSGNSLLDLGCGQGILSRQIPEKIFYQGVDIAPSLIETAKRMTRRPDTNFTVADITKPINIPKIDFSHAAIILAFQNVDSPLDTLLNAALHLKENGVLVMVINHPYFRIPRFTSWGVDESKKLQYRRVDSYLTFQKIPISANPSQQSRSPITWSFHYSLQEITKFLNQAGFVIETIEEWVSDKESIGKSAKMENRARQEFPLFMAIKAVKV
jgi:ubiquinone/menaquinone biosynthesis C-methylase UbiE